MILICAHDQNNIIGYDNTIPWKISEDLKRFCKLTLNHIVIMGRKTFQSISKPLNGRINIVITRNPEKMFPFKDVYYTTLENLDNLLSSIEHKEKNIFLIGGSEIYEQLIEHCDTMYITEVYRPYSNPEMIDPKKYSYFKYDVNNWKQLFRSHDFTSSENSHVFYNFVHYVKI
jgi:dihydrofolate reductase